MEPSLPGLTSWKTIGAALLFPMFLGGQGGGSGQTKLCLPRACVLVAITVINLNLVNLQLGFGTKSQVTNLPDLNK